MKKIILLCIVLLTGLNLFGQEVIPPEGWGDLYENYGEFFLTYLGVAGIAMFLGEYVIRLLRATQKWQKVTLIFILAVGVSFIGNGINIGYLAEATWYETILWGVLSGVAANGLFSSNLLWLRSGVEYTISLIKKKV